MARSPRISVTKNVVEAVKELKKALKEMPEGKGKERAQAAVKYLDTHVVKGEKQPNLGKSCPKWFYPPPA